MKSLKVVVVCIIFVSMALLPVLAEEVKEEIEVLWGKQIAGWGMTNAKTEGNTVELTKTAEVTKVEGDAKTYCIWSGGRSVLCGNSAKSIVGEKLEAGKYTVMAGLSDKQKVAKVSVYLEYAK
jgi:hypothetical protein